MHYSPTITNSMSECKRTRVLLICIIRLFDFTLFYSSIAAFLIKGLFTLANLTEFNAHRMRIGRVHTVLRPMRIE